MSDSSLAVQTALYELLSYDLSVPVYDHVPQDEIPAFVQIGEGQELAADTKTYHATDHYVDINVYSRQRGLKEIKQILGEVYELLHRQPMAVAGFESTMLQFESQVMFQEPEGSRGLARFRFHTISS